MLSIIGLIFILWFASKGLKHLGNFLTRLGDDMINYSNTTKRSFDAPTKKSVSDLKDKITAVKETEDDRTFKSDIRKEIEELTEEN